MHRNLQAIFISHYMFRLRILYPYWTLSDYVSSAHSRWHTFKNNPAFIKILQEFADTHPQKIGYTLQEQEALRCVYEKIRELEFILSLDSSQWKYGMVILTECKYISSPQSSSVSDIANDINNLVY